MDTITNIVVSNTAIAVLLAGLVLVLTKIWRNPQLAHALWLLVLLKLITPPLVPVTLSWSSRSVDIEPSAPRQVDAHQHLDAWRAAMHSLLLEEGVPNASEWQDPPPLAALEESKGEQHGRQTFTTRLSQFVRTHGVTIVVVFWIAGAGLCGGMVVFRCFRFRHVLQSAEDAAGQVAATAERLAARLAIKTCPPVRITTACIPPLVWSLGMRPLVLLPAQLLAELEPAQRDAVIAHELAHVKRRDYLVRWLEVLVLVPCWWNPLVWFAQRKLRAAEEECCDAWVVWAMPDERRSYGQAMFKTIEFLTESHQPPAMAGSMLGRSFYKRRIEMILKQKMNRQMSWTAFASVFVLAAIVLPLVAQTAAPTDEQPPNVELTLDGQEDHAEVEDLDIDIELAVAEDIDLDLAAEREAAAEIDLDVPDLNAVVDLVVALESTDEDSSIDALLSRIKKLETALQSPARDGKERSDEDASSATDSVASQDHAATAAAPSDHREDELQAKLLELDVEAAASELELARADLQRASAHAKLQRAKGEITESLDHFRHEIEKLNAVVRIKMIELERAKVRLELFARHAELRRDQAARLDEEKQKLKSQTSSQKQMIQMMKRQALAMHDKAAQQHKLLRMKQGELAQLQREGQMALRLKAEAANHQAIAEAEGLARQAAELEAMQRDRFAALEARSKQLVDEMSRIERMIKESADSPRIAQAVEEFLKTHLRMSEEEAKAVAERLKSAKPNE